jgi:hypothetical protein
MFYGIVLFLLGAAALALALFGRDLTQLLRSPMRNIAESIGAPSGKPGSPLVPDSARTADLDAPARLPPRYPLTPQMRVFFAVIGVPLFGLGLVQMTRDVFPGDSGDDTTEPPAGATSTAQPPATAASTAQPPASATSTATAPATTQPVIDCPPVPADFFRIGEYYRRPNMEGPSFQVVDPALGGDPDVLWIDRFGMPVINPRFPLGPEAVAVSEAFGSPQAAVDFNRCTLRPVVSQ